MAMTTPKTAASSPGDTYSATSPPVMPPIVVAISSVMPRRMFVRPEPT